jgi:hypothetical protein
MTGFIMSTVPNVNAADLDVTSVRVTFDDAFGKKHQTDSIKEQAAVSTFLKTPGLGKDLGACK